MPHWIVPFGAAAVVLAACATEPPESLGPLRYDAGGATRCSAMVPAYNKACGYRVVRHADSAEIWLANIDHSRIRSVHYRVLSYADGKLTARDGSPVEVLRNGGELLVNVADHEFYRLPLQALSAH